MIDDWAFVENLLCSRARDFLNIFVDVLTHPIVIYHIRWYFILHFYLQVPGYYFYRKNCTFEHVITKLMYCSNRKNSRGVGWLDSSCSFLTPIFYSLFFLFVANLCLSILHTVIILNLCIKKWILCVVTGNWTFCLNMFSKLFG